MTSIKKSNIFGSASERACFKQLELFYSGKNLFTYPQLRIASFVDYKNVEHLLSQNKWRYYFLNCSVDWVVCNSEGDVLCAYEWWGPDHYNIEAIKKQDEFKKQVIPCSGVSLIIITYLDKVELDDLPSERKLGLLDAQAYEWQELRIKLSQFQETLEMEIKDLLKKK